MHATYVARLRYRSTHSTVKGAVRAFYCTMSWTSTEPVHGCGSVAFRTAHLLLAGTDCGSLWPCQWIQEVCIAFWFSEALQRSEQRHHYRPMAGKRRRHTHLGFSCTHFHHPLLCVLPMVTSVNNGYLFRRFLLPIFGAYEVYIYRVLDLLI